MNRVNWIRANRRSQTWMHVAMMLFFLCLGVCLGAVTVRTLPVIGHVDATVVDAHRVVLSIGGTASQLRKASEDESKQIAGVTAQVQTDLKTLNGVLASLKTTVDTLNKTAQTANDQVAKIGPVLDQTKTTLAAVEPVLSNVTTATAGISKIANDPNIPKTLANAQSATASVAAAADSGKKIAKHYEDEITAPVKKAKTALMTAAKVASWFVRLVFNF